MLTPVMLATRSSTASTWTPFRRTQCDPTLDWRHIVSKTHLPLPPPLSLPPSQPYAVQVPCKDDLTLHVHPTPSDSDCFIHQRIALCQIQRLSRTMTWDVTVHWVWCGPYADAARCSALLTPKPEPSQSQWQPSTSNHTTWSSGNHWTRPLHPYGSLDHLDTSLRNSLMSSSHLFFGLPIALLVLYLELSSGFHSAVFFNHLSLDGVVILSVNFYFIFLCVLFQYRIFDVSSCLKRQLYFFWCVRSNSLLRSQSYLFLFQSLHQMSLHCPHDLQICALILIAFFISATVFSLVNNSFLIFGLNILLFNFLVFSFRLDDES